MDGCIWISGFAVIILKYLLHGRLLLNNCWNYRENPGVYNTQYSLFGPSSVWSESSSSRAKYSEFESSSKYSQGPAQWAVQNDANIKLFLKVLCRVKYLYYTISDKRQQRLTYQFEEFCQRWNKWDWCLKCNVPFFNSKNYVAYYLWCSNGLFSMQKRWVVGCRILRILMLNFYDFSRIWEFENLQKNRPIWYISKCRKKGGLSCPIQRILMLNLTISEEFENLKNLKICKKMSNLVYIQMLNQPHKAALSSSFFFLLKWF